MLEMMLCGLIAHNIQHGRFAQYRDRNQARIAIKQLYDNANVAASRRDIADVFKDCDVGFHGITSNGVRVSLPQMKIHTGNLFAASTSVKASSTILHLTLTGDIAEVLVKEDATIVMRQPGTNETAILESNEIDKDTWVEKKGVWKEQEAKIEMISQHLNGKPISK